MYKENIVGHWPGKYIFLALCDISYAIQVNSCVRNESWVIIVYYFETNL